MKLKNVILFKFINPLQRFVFDNIGTLMNTCEIREYLFYYIATLFEFKCLYWNKVRVHGLYPFIFQISIK